MGNGVLRLVGLVGTLACAGAVLPAVAGAATITPTTTLDVDVAGGACSLREAITAANTDGNYNDCVAVGTAVDEGPDTIVLANGAIYVRTITPDTDEDGNVDGDLDVVDAGGGQEEDLTITATGSDGAAIRGNAIASGGRVLHVVSADAILSISRVEIEQGRDASNGGGILNFGTLNLTESLVTLNTSDIGGGGIENAGTLNATNVTIQGNFARDSGAGLENFNPASTATLNNVTVTGNQANTAVATDPDGVGGGINHAGGTLNLRNTIVAGNSQAFLPFPGPVPDCAGGPTSLGNNLIGNTSGCGWTSTTGDVTNPASPGVAFALGENGGPTRTVALLAGSPAQDAGNPAAPGSGGNACAATDQRGIARPLGPRCDIGAFEAAAAPGNAATVPSQPTMTPKKCKKKKKKKRGRAALAAKKKKKKKCKR